MSGAMRMLTLLAGAAVGVVAAPAEARTLHLDHVLGTSLDMTAVGQGADAAFAAALAEIGRLDPLLSGWRQDSELARLNAAAEAEVSPDLYAVIAAAEAWRARSGGAFDGRLGRMEALWRMGEAEGAPPDPMRLIAMAARLAPVGLDPATRRVARPAGVALALDGLAKGYVVDAALAAGRSAAPGLKGLMIDIGGDLAVWGTAPSGGRWRLGVADPARPEDNAAPAFTLAAGEGAVATSGAGPRDRTIGGRRYPHLIDPRTGLACANRSATAFAPRAVDADALAAALAVLPPRDGLALAESFPGAEAVVFDGKGRAHATPGWTAAPVRLIRTAAPAAAGAPWPARFAVTVDYEIPRIAEPKAYPPYVTIWITDASNLPVRQLLLLGDDQNYIDQNYIWWRRVGRAAPAVVDAVSRPTRRAGRYSAVWDGKDNAGRPVAQGRYTIHVEAVREHGGHSYQTIQVQLGAEPAEGAAAGSEELGASRVRYGPRG